MDAVSRSRRILLSSLFWGLVVGCATTEPNEAIGSSHTPPRGSHAPEHDAAVAETSVALSPLPTDYRTSWNKENVARFVSTHAMGRYDADVFANAAVTGVSLKALPVGSRFVEEHVERGSNRPGPFYMMEKREPGFDTARGDWRYVVVGPEGDALGDGLIEGCVGCHGEAPGDHIFPIN